MFTLGGRSVGRRRALSAARGKEEGSAVRLRLGETQRQRERKSGERGRRWRRTSGRALSEDLVAERARGRGVFVLMMTYLLDAHDEGPLQLYKSPMENSGRCDHLRFSAEKSVIYERDFFRSNRSLDWPMFRAALKGNPQTAFSNLTAVCVCVHTYVYRQIEIYI